MLSIQLDVAGKECLCIGGGAVAERRLAVLLQENMKITVISPAVTTQIKQWAEEKKLSWIAREMIDEDIKSVFLVMAMTDQPTINERIEGLARKQGAFVNRADSSSHSTVTFPAITQIGDIKFAVVTGEMSPRINKLIREDIEEHYKALAQALPYIGQVRKELKTILPTGKERAAFWRKILTKERFKELLNGQRKDVEERINSAISSLRDKS